MLLLAVLSHVLFLLRHLYDPVRSVIRGFYRRLLVCNSAPAIVCHWFWSGLLPPRSIVCTSIAVAIACNAQLDRTSKVNGKGDLLYGYGSEYISTWMCICSVKVLDFSELAHFMNRD